MTKLRSYRWQNVDCNENLRRVIVADDDQEMRSLLAGALRKEGYCVVEAKDGAELLEQLEFDVEENGWVSLFDVVVSDVRMPGVTGLEVLEGIREVDESTGVILISAFADQQVHDEARRLGARRVLAKPFALDDFVAAVRDAVRPLAME
ncbi:MAG: response regulator [Myxococcota bacterium]